MTDDGSMDLRFLPHDFSLTSVCGDLAVLIAYDCRDGVGYRTRACGGGVQLFPP
jgi:hypothetical protein